jgi:hypothetical protein
MRHAFNAAYDGDGYLLLASPTNEPVVTDVTIVWGVWRYSASITALPGNPNTREGGTLLTFHKSVDHGPSPGMHVMLSVPACATIAVADGTTVAPATTINTGPGWTGG